MTSKENDVILLPVPFADATLTQTEKTATSQTWKLAEARSPGQSLYLYREYDSRAGRWRRRFAAAGVDTRALIGQAQAGGDEYGKPLYVKDTDESRAAEIAVIETAFRAAMERKK